ncbi:hypothetical protein JYU34_011311 [Plutella xylostella]|uniref:Uncharacterized protein n=1 Tax=Plutella xylostella TaxID=51655 RepID=A0ABQ7QGN9_PLUXY|nr:hypothetical protein JYU34_011311 [Plutella xylostella]
MRDEYNGKAIYVKFWMFEVVTFGEEQTKRAAPRPPRDWPPVVLRPPPPPPRVPLTHHHLHNHREKNL